MNAPLDWSREFEFTADSINSNAVASPGVYELLQDAEYARYRGSTRVLKIGKSDSDLRSEILNHLGRHTASNRIKRLQLDAKKVYFRFLEIQEGDPGGHERQLLKEFEDEHWELPLLNSQRGYGRGEDTHYGR